MTEPNYYSELQKIHQSDLSLTERYFALRKLLESILKEFTYHQDIQFPDLYSKLTFVCEQLGLNSQQQLKIQMFRKNAHLILLKEKTPTNEMYLYDLATFIKTIQLFTGKSIPEQLLKDISPLNITEEPISSFEKNQQNHIPLIRFYVQEIHHQYFIGKADEINLEQCKVVFDISNTLFKETILEIEVGQVLQLVDCQINDDTITAQIFISEPDFLIDISTIAECFKEYGRHPYFYYINRLQSKTTSTPILIGNIANQFLDIFVHAPSDKEISFLETIKNIFKLFPFDISINSDLDDNQKMKDFLQQAEQQFNHIKYVVREVFPKLNIDVNKSTLEPSFICATLGIQGRLDFLAIDNQHTTIIELKSGKAPFPENQTELIGESHKAQLFLYQIVIQIVLGIKFKDIHSFLLYSKYPDPKSNMRMIKPYMDKIKEILNIRNQIANIEKKIAKDESFLPKLIDHITPEILLNSNNQNNRFIQQYIIPQIKQFNLPFQNSSKLELAYFYQFYNFISKELYISKAGVSYNEQSLGHASLWLSDADDKLDSGDILLDLTIIENLSNYEIPTIRLNIPEYGTYFLPNFRQGDIVVLYERNTPKDNVTNKQILRGNIAQIQHNEIVVRLRNSQNNTLFFPSNSKYAIEHDFMDSSFGSMFRGLYSFLDANKERRELILHQRTPTTDTTLQLIHPCIHQEIEEIVLKAKQAKDYFLLIGPPGTGKTSIALKAMVREFYSDNNNILLLSYTNRAVDEICSSIAEIEPKIKFIRIGSEQSTDEQFHSHLLQNILKECSKRDEVKRTLIDCRVFVGTVASISGKLELFRLKKFQIAIIDEASQILEPQLIGILSAKHISNQNAIEKFILIGDHKQLPAIVVQHLQAATFQEPLLIQAGFTDRRVSFFERLYRYHEQDKNSPHWAILKRQGRMHAEIASFSNQFFYNNQLMTVPTIHQAEKLAWKKWSSDDKMQQIIGTKRIAFFPSEKNENDTSFKVNSNEAKIVVSLLKNIYQFYQSHNFEFDFKTSVGIITPYRSQIALIRKEIFALDIPILNNITIDTVERYQGSQRDIIIYSFCVNHSSQLKLLSNTFKENNQIIDRKLNVALTRAKKQMFITGNPYFLSKNKIFNDLVQHIENIQDK
ncbi:MAG: AAA family ATPase [Chitinophagales bacterium]|nr:AAA domain-containing protein [Chitinophagales bacterium]MCZ2393345.1 AAA family ATPase [Chitinophagales bacterium]